MNTRLFLSIMVLNGDNLNTLSEYMGITRVTLGKKINKFPQSCFTVFEIRKIIKRYNLTPQQVIDIFFDWNDLNES